LQSGSRSSECSYWEVLEPIKIFHRSNPGGKMVAQKKQLCRHAMGI
jgi:hypothetical protein